MSTKIDGMNGLPGLAPTAGVGSARPGSGKGNVQPAADAGGVHLSKDALQLQSLQGAAQSSPDVDEARVAQVKRALSDGTYQVDARSVAVKLLALERQLPK
ncbi:MAG TPA: flagellar biosynthesis anti-sigma factor FlgM [Nevskiaceae bacterium]|nr:flagellar biosynthesis anti-sigma factor FlgM [Nevskiaceae bacterium]